MSEWMNKDFDWIAWAKRNRFLIVNTLLPEQHRALKRLED